MRRTVDVDEGEQDGRGSGRNGRHARIWSWRRWWFPSNMDDDDDGNGNGNGNNPPPPINAVDQATFQRYHAFVHAHTADATYAARVRTEYATCSASRRTVLDATVQAVWTVNRTCRTLTDRMLRRARTTVRAILDALDGAVEGTDVAFTVDPPGTVGPVVMGGTRRDHHHHAFRWHVRVGTRTWTVPGDAGEVFLHWYGLRRYRACHAAWWCGGDTTTNATVPYAYATFQYMCRTVACTTRM